MMHPNYSLAMTVYLKYSKVEIGASLAGTETDAKANCLGLNHEFPIDSMINNRYGQSCAMFRTIRSIET